MGFLGAKGAKIGEYVFIFHKKTVHEGPFFCFFYNKFWARKYPGTVDQTVPGYFHREKER